MAIPSSVLMLGYIATASEVRSLAPGEKGARIFSLFNILLKS